MGQLLDHAQGHTVRWPSTPQVTLVRRQGIGSSVVRSVEDLRSGYPAALNIAELREAARRRLPRGLYEFVLRGTEDDCALTRNSTDFEQLAMRPRVLADVSARSTQHSFFGATSAMPVAVAPTGAAGLLWFDGEIEVARAARHAGIPFTLSTASIISMERVANEAGGRLWFQLYMLPELRMSLQLVERARSAGYEALIVTVDVPATPNREFNQRNGFSLPLRVTTRNAMDVALHPKWLFRVFLPYLLRSGIPMLENYPDELRARLTARPDVKAGLPKADRVTWADLKELRRHWTGPLMVKGILRAEDAAMAVDCGADAVIVSNHGGRAFDGSISALMALPPILEKVGARASVFLDGGIERGVQIAKAMSLGADGVFVGRAPLWGVSAAGAKGAARALGILNDELERALAFLGCASVSELDRSLLAFPGLCNHPTSLHSP